MSRTPAPVLTQAERDRRRLAIAFNLSLGFVGLLVAAVIALYHYTLIRARERGACFRAFRHNTWLGAAVFAGLLIDDLLRSV